MPARDILAALAVALLWGGNFTAIKLAVGEFPPLFMSAMRFSAVFALLVWMVPLPRGRFRDLAVLSVAFGFVHFGIMGIAMTGVDAAAAAIVIQLNVPFAAILAAVFLKDPFGPRRWAGLLIALAGVVVFAGESRASSVSWHLALVGLSALGWGVGQVLVKRMGGINTIALNAWVSGMLAPQLFVMSWLFEDNQIASAGAAGVAGWGGVAYQVIGASVLAYGLWYTLLGKYEVSKVVPYNLLVPVFGVIGGVVLLGEGVSAEKVIGGAITLLGVALIQLSTVRRPALAQEE